MLRYNIKRILKARFITQPVGYLSKHGFSKPTAQRIVSGRTKNITTKQLEKLCLAFNCTPDDLMEWTPDNQTQLEQKPQLQQLIRSEPQGEFKDLLVNIPLNKMQDFTKEIEELKKRFTV